MSDGALVTRPGLIRNSEPPEAAPACRTVRAMGFVRDARRYAGEAHWRRVYAARVCATFNWTKEHTMPATPEELKRLVDAFEEAHAPVARAMADLLIRGNVILEEHRMLEGPIGDAFEAFVFRVLDDNAIQKETFAKTLVALDRLRETVDQLDQLPP